jgi:hypothetical protein
VTFDDDDDTLSYILNDNICIRVAQTLVALLNIGTPTGQGGYIYKYVVKHQEQKAW